MPRKDPIGYSRQHGATRSPRSRGVQAVLLMAYEVSGGHWCWGFAIRRCHSHWVRARRSSRPLGQRLRAARQGDGLRRAPRPAPKRRISRSPSSLFQRALGGDGPRLTIASTNLRMGARMSDRIMIRLAVNPAGSSAGGSNGFALRAIPRQEGLVSPQLEERAIRNQTTVLRLPNHKHHAREG